MKFTILKRLTFGYIAIMLLVIFMAVYVTLKLQQLHELTYEISTRDVTTTRLAEHLLDNLLTHVRFEKKYLISKDRDFYQQFHKTKDDIHDQIKRLEPLLDTSKKKALLFEMKGLYTSYLSLFEQDAKLVEQGKGDARLKYQSKRDELVDRSNQLLGRIIVLTRRDVDRKITKSSQISQRVLKVTMVTSGLTILMGLVVSLVNTRSINQSITLLKKKTKEITIGHFPEISDIKSPPEIKQLAEDFNAMSKRLKELDEMKLDFISHVSHELRTPLTAIKEASGMLLDGTVINAPEKQKELLLITKKECERLIETVNRMLDLSRMEAKMMDYYLIQTHLAPVLQESVLKLAPIAYSKGIDFELRPFPELPMVNIDTARIGQLMDNLLGNALKYTPKGGMITVDVSVEGNDREFVKVSVSDKGRGIPRENLEKIFDRFKRIESGKETARGTGLGLSIAKHIVANHGGKIWAESEPGKGSTFVFTLPV